jgi:hypothetical protein
MRYDKGSRLRDDAERVSNGAAANQSQESLDDQLKDLHVLARRFGLYDAADWLHKDLEHRERYHCDFGEPLGREEITRRVNKSLDPTFPDEAGRLS